MKKNKFLNGLSVKLTLAVVALTAMFASCSNENIEFELKPADPVEPEKKEAKLVIDVRVFVEGELATADAKITIDGKEGPSLVETKLGEDIVGRTIEIAVDYKNGLLTTKKPVTFETVLAGETLKMPIDFQLFYPDPDDSEDSDYAHEEIGSKPGEDKVTKDEFVNKSDYSEIKSVIFEYISGSEFSSMLIDEAYKNDSAIKKAFEEYVANATKNNKKIVENRTEEITIISHSSSTFTVTTEITYVTYEVTLNGVVIGTYTTAEYNTDYKKSENNQIPDYPYQPGHTSHDNTHNGHDHGHGSGNAGGGLGNAD